MNIRPVLVLALACAVPLSAQAIDLVPHGVFVQGGIADHASYSLTAGVLGLVPLLRYRFGQGRSGWFIEAGIGVSLMDPIYRTSEKQFSTRFNFVDVAGVGRSFGSRRERELSLRIAHVSNADIKKPNPGENFLQLRYAVLF